MSDESKSGSFWTTLPGILTGIAAIITAVGGLVAALAAAGVFDDDDGDSAGPQDTVVTTTISGEQNPVSTTAAPQPAATTGTISVNYNPEGLGCNLLLEIDVGGAVFVPSGLQHVQTGVPLGDQSYAINGQITCATGFACDASGSGALSIADQRSYNVLWQESGFGLCEVFLQ